MKHQGTNSRYLVTEGFTLVELMVAMAVMTMVLTLLLSVSSGILTTTRLCNQTLNATEQARSVLDTLDGDLANRVVGRGLTIYASQAAESSANPELAFLIQGRGPSATSRLVGVSYQLAADGTMRRFSEAVLWTQSDLVPQVLGSLSSTTSSIIGKGILRFSVCAVLDNGAIVSFTDSSSESTWKTATGGSGDASFFGMNFAETDARSVRALVIGIVAVDESNYQQLQKSGKLDQAIAAFPAPSMSGAAAINTPSDWAASLSNRDNANLNTIPPSALAAMQVLQSTFFFQ